MSQDLAQPAPLSTSRDAARRGAPVGTLAAYLCIGTWLTMVSTSYGIALLAGARPKYMSLGQMVKVVLLVGPAWIVATRFGTAGVALVVSLPELGLIAASMVGCRASRWCPWDGIWA